jgi:hypothetical protein
MVASRLSAVLIALLLTAGSAPAFDRIVRGVVADESGGVLPGVTVTAAGADGVVLATTVTDGQGRYTLGPIADARVTLTFQLDGFESGSTQVSLTAGSDSVADQRLALAKQTETVTVVGKAPAPRPILPPPPPPKPRPRLVTTPVPEHDRDSVCGPAKIEGPIESSGTIRSRRFAANAVYGEGDELVIAGGTSSGLQAGRNYVVRRTFRIEWDPRTEIGEHTAGLVQVAEADAESAQAVVIYACDEMLPGDRLVPFTAMPKRAAERARTPDFRNAARILFPDIGQLLGAPRRMLVIDRGFLLGVRVGQRVSVFRTSPASRTPAVVGEAVVVSVRSDSATIRVDSVSGAIFEGDLAALHR